MRGTSHVHRASAVSPLAMSWFGGAGFDADNDVASLRQQLALEREGKAKLAQLVERASGGTVLADLQHQLDAEKRERARAAATLAGEGASSVVCLSSSSTRLSPRVVGVCLRGRKEGVTRSPPPVVIYTMAFLC